MVQDRMHEIFLSRAVDVDAVRTSRRFISQAVRRAIDDLVMDRLEHAGWPFPVTVEGLKHVQEARASQRGAIILTGHFFGNRLARRYLAAQGYPMMSVRHFEPPDRFMGRAGRRWLQPRYIDFLHQVIRHEVALQDRERSLKIFKHIRRGGLANINMEPAFSKAAAQMPFFGRDWLFPTGIYRIARMADCAVVPMLGLGDSRGLRIQFAPPVTLEPEDRGEQQADRDLARFVPMLESWILQYPDQWELWDRL